MYQTFLRMVFQNVRNLCAISGDAVQLLPRHVGSASVDSIFINHPEPPVQYGGSDHKRQKVGGEAGAEAWKGDAFGKHLLTLVSGCHVCAVGSLLLTSCGAAIFRRVGAGAGSGWNYYTGDRQPLVRTSSIHRVVHACLNFSTVSDPGTES